MLAADLVERKRNPVIALTSDLSAQAVLLASSAQVSFGEDFFDSGASLKGNPSAAAALRAQDLLRIVITVGLILGAVLRLLGVWQ